MAGRGIDGEVQIRGEASETRDRNERDRDQTRQGTQGIY